MGNVQVVKLLNQLLGAYWTGVVQHKTHVEILKSCSLLGLAAEMEKRIADEPLTVKKLQERLHNLGGFPSIEIKKPQLGKSVSEILAVDLEIQKLAKPVLNDAIEEAVKAKDATTRILFEEILRDEEAHFAWLQAEVDLLNKLGEQLYFSMRAR